MYIRRAMVLILFFAKIKGMAVQSSDVIYRFTLCVYATFVYACMATFMSIYPHAHCRK